MGTEGEELGDFVEEFEEANPDADVKVTAVPWESAHDKLSNAIASGETPDVSLIGTTWMGEFAEAGGLMPTPEGLVDEGDFFPGAVGVDRGRRHVVRRALVRRDPGALLPHRPGREGRLGRGAADLGRAQAVRGRPGGARAAPSSASTSSPARPARGRPCCRSPGPTARPSPTRTAPSTRSTRPRWPRRSTTTPPTSRRASARPGCSTPVSSRAASPTASTAPSSPVRGTPPWSRTPAPTPDQYAVAPLPGKDGAPGTSFVGGGDLAVFNESDNADSAWKYVQWLTEPEIQQAFYEEVGRPAGRPGRLGHRRRWPRTRSSRSSAPARDRRRPAGRAHVGAGRRLDRRDHRAGLEGRPRLGRGRGRDAVEGGVDRHRSLTHAHPGDHPHGRPRGQQGRRDPRPARGPHAAAAGCRRVGPRRPVHGAVPGLHGRAGAGEPRDELHRHPQHGRAQPVRGGVRRARQLHRAAQDPLFRKVTLNTLLYLVLGVPLTMAVALAVAVGLNRIQRLQGLLPGRVLPAGRDQHRRGLGRVEVPAARRRRADQHHHRLVRRRRPGLARHHLVRAADAGRDGGLAQLRHPDGDLPGRAADRAARDHRGRRVRRRQPVGPVPLHHAAHAAPDAAVRRGDHLASATSSSSRRRS